MIIKYRISGIDCAGKSSLAERLASLLRSDGLRVQVLHGDDFLFERSVRYSNSNHAEGYYRESFDYRTLFHELLVPAR